MYIILNQVSYAIIPPEEQNQTQNITLQANSLNLNKAIEIGILNNPTLKVLRSKLSISDAQILQSKLIPNPSSFQIMDLQKTHSELGQNKLLNLETNEQDE